jgi:hypothetical protein
MRLKDYQTKNQTMRVPQPSTQDTTAGLAANVELLRGMWTGTDDRINLAAPLLYAPVNTIRALVGSPILVADNPETQAYCNSLMKRLLVDEAPLITQSALVMGTTWRFPRMLQNGRLIWETIPDDEVQGLRDDGGEITELWTHKIVTENRRGSPLALPALYTERRHFTRDYIDIETTGAVSRRERVYNWLRSMPSPFGHDCWEGSWRGTSVYSRVFRTAKFSHDVLYKAAQILSKFNPKLVQSLFDAGEKTAENWLEQRLNVKKLDVLQAELLVNVINDAGQSETTDLKSLASDAVAGHERMLDRLYKMIIDGSGIPEIFWPQQLTGAQNYATASTQTMLGIETIKGIQREMTKWYEKCANESAALESYVNMSGSGSIRVEWSKMTILAPTERAQVFSGMASGLSSLYNSGVLTENGLLYWITQFFPDYPDKTPEELTAEILKWTEKVKQSSELAVTSGDLF